MLSVLFQTPPPVCPASEIRPGRRLDGGELLWHFRDNLANLTRVPSVVLFLYVGFWSSLSSERRPSVSASTGHSFAAGSVLRGSLLLVLGLFRWFLVWSSARCRRSSCLCCPSFSCRLLKRRHAHWRERKKTATVKSKEKVCDSLKLLHPPPGRHVVPLRCFLGCARNAGLASCLVEQQKDMSTSNVFALVPVCVCVRADGCWTVNASCCTRLSTVVHSEVCPLPRIFFARSM